MVDTDRKRFREFFGRDLSDDEQERLGPILTRQLDALERLRAWEPELHLIEPATIPRTAKTDQR